MVLVNRNHVKCSGGEQQEIWIWGPKRAKEQYHRKIVSNRNPAVGHKPRTSRITRKVLSFFKNISRLFVYYYFLCCFCQMSRTSRNNASHSFGEAYFITYGTGTNKINGDIFFKSDSLSRKLVVYEFREYPM